MIMPWQERGHGALLRAALLSVVVHAGVVCLDLVPGNNPVPRVPATLVVFDRDRVRTPPRPTLHEASKPINTQRANPVIDKVGRVKPVSLNVDSPAHYYPPDELDKRAFPLANLDFPYPEVAGADQPGTLELTFYVGVAGVVDEIRIDFASVDQRIVDLAVESLRATPFSPGERDGQAVGARLRLAVDYARLSP